MFETLPTLLQVDMQKWWQKSQRRGPFAPCENCNSRTSRYHRYRKWLAFKTFSERKWHSSCRAWFLRITVSQPTHAADTVVGECVGKPLLNFKGQTCIPKQTNANWPCANRKKTRLASVLCNTISCHIMQSNTPFLLSLFLFFLDSSMPSIFFQVSFSWFFKYLGHRWILFYWV